MIRREAPPQTSLSSHRNESHFFLSSNFPLQCLPTELIPVPVVLPNDSIVPKLYCPLGNSASGNAIISNFDMSYSNLWIDIGVLYGYWYEWSASLLVDRSEGVASWAI